MHMADALISPAVGGTLWAAAAGLAGYSSRKLRASLDTSLVPLMGVLGAFVFAAQMINFTIPGTGSSGHLGGGMLLAVLLGPYAAFLTIASVLVVQALFFADGGLLALGCNIFNLGFFPCFVALPFIYKPLAGGSPTRGRLMAACIAAAVGALSVGAFAVAVETVFSGITALPFKAFALLMLPIHVAIGVVEGLITAAVAAFVQTARPELLASSPKGASWPIKKVAAAFALCALFTGGVLSWFASTRPDGLEWSIARVAGSEELHGPEQGAHAILAKVQEKTALMPDYAFKETPPPTPGQAMAEPPPQAESVAGGNHEPEAWPAVDSGSSLAGILGGALTLLLVWAASLLLRKRGPTHSG